MRDGGLHEDSIKLFSMLVHPRTSQKYDRGVLSKDWDLPLATTLQAEKEHFSNLHEALQNKSSLIEECATATEIKQIGEEICQLIGSTPPQYRRFGTI